MDQQPKDPDALNVLVLERVDRTKNMARYYVLSVEPTLFAESSLVRRWGRIGGAGRTRIDLHASPPLAQIALKTWLERKRRRGYRLRAWLPTLGSLRCSLCKNPRRRRHSAADLQ
jgi:predicted DNA-binding WGR domain protein